MPKKSIFCSFFSIFRRFSSFFCHFLHWKAIFHLQIAFSALFCAVFQAHAGDLPGWRIAFNSMPADWSVQGKPFTKQAVFHIASDPTNNAVHWLSMTADDASASLKSSNPLPVDLNKTPIIRWCWRATVLPTGADGRDPKKDDQAIGISCNSQYTASKAAAQLQWIEFLPTPPTP